MPATFKFFVYKNRTDENKETPIYLRITCHRKKKYYNTGLRIEPHYLRENPKYGYWIKKSHPNYKSLNEELAYIFDKAKEAARVLRREDEESAQGVKDRIIGASKENFFVMAKEELEALDQDDQYYLRKQTKATLTKLEEFNGNQELKFTEISSDYLIRFQEWMHRERGNKPSTIRKNMSDMRRILTRARDANLIFHDPFEDVKPIKQQAPEPKVKLSHSQIKAMADLNLPEDSIEYHARNIFVLSFYLNGVRFGDMVKMKWSRVEGGKLSYRMSKTGNVVYFPIPDAGQRILAYYRHKETASDDFIFPFLKNLPDYRKSTVENKVSQILVDVNDALKDVARKAGVDEEKAKKVSSHVARHSFAQYLVEKGVSIYEISRQLRHTSVSTTENYLDRLGLQAKDQTMETPFDDE